jgi:hypothetical protein
LLNPGWVDVGNETKVKWIYLVFHKKKKIRIRGKNIDQLTFIGEITAFRVMHYIRVENNFPTIGT